MNVGSTRRWFALAALALAVLATALDMTVLNVALPTLALDLHADASALQWFASAYTLTVAAVMLPTGALGDRYGRRRFLLVALAIFGLASAACAYSTSPGELIAARVALGVGGAMIMPLSMAQLPLLFPDSRGRDRAMAVWLGALVIGTPLGPIVGGWLLQHFWWGSVFLINVPLTVIGIIAVVALVPESRSQTAHPLDLAGTALSSLGLVGVTYGFIRAGDQGWDDVAAVTTLVVGVVLLVLFVAWQRRSTHPLIDLRLFRDRGFRWGTLYSVINAFAMFGLTFTVPMYFQGVLGVDALGSGLRLLPMIGGMLVANALAEPLKARLGTRNVLLAGFVTSAIGLVLGSLTTVASGFWFVALWTTVLGLGFGAVMITATTLALGSLAPERSGIGSALITVLRNVGSTLGPAVLGTLTVTRYRDQLGSFDVSPIRDSVVAGVSAAARLNNPAVVDLVRSAFVSGMSLLLIACAVVCGLAALSVGLRRRRRATEPQVPTAKEEAPAER